MRPLAGLLPERLLGAAASAACGAGAVPWLVGGAVRDALLGRPPLDLDVAVEGPPDAVARMAASLEGSGWRREALHREFGTATLRAPSGQRVDLAATREEHYPYPGALPVVRVGAAIARDLARRDFGIHAMALPVEEAGAGAALLDPYGGEEDLGLRRIRLLHGGSLADDPTRVFRAARYAARLGFELDGEFPAAMERASSAGAFARISGDRLRRALGELLSEQNRRVAVDLLDRLGVPSAIVDGWSFAAVRLEAPEAGEAAGDAWNALLAPSPPEVRARVAARLSFSRALRRVAGCSS